MEKMYVVDLYLIHTNQASGVLNLMKELQNKIELQDLAN